MLIEITESEYRKLIGGDEAEGVRLDSDTKIFALTDGHEKIVTAGAIKGLGSSRVTLKMDFTDPEYRRMGYHAALVRAREAVAKNYGARVVQASCLPTSLKLYLRLGYSIKKERKNGAEVERAL